jgi:parallel beta-helix repeat protein
MQKGRRVQFVLALVGTLMSSGPLWAGDSLLPIDRCQELNGGEQTSFVLVKNIFAPGRGCLTVTTNHVTIDMRGFSISGNGTGAGISASSNVVGVTVRNGTVKGFAVGMSLAGPGNIVQDMHLDNNADTGLFAGTNSLVDHVIAQGNRKWGIVATTASTVRNSLLRTNGNSPESGGLSAGVGCTVTGNTISSSIGTGLFVSAGSTVSGNTVLDTNPGVGISVVCPSNVQNNTSTSNTQGNFFVTDDTCNVLDNLTPLAP